MIPLLLAPLGLAALAALVVPLLIHLHRRTEQVPTDFAALRWLEQRPRPRRRFRLDEWPLLIVRLLLIAALAVLLAEPALRGGADRQPRILVAPGVDPRAIGDKAGADVRWLAPDFPTIDGPAPSRPVPTASLIRQIDAELPAGTPLTLVVPAVMAGADADRLRLSRRVQWRIVPGAAPVERSNSASAPAMTVVASSETGSGVGYLRSAAMAWGGPSGGQFKVASTAMVPTIAAGQALVWLRSDIVPETVRNWVEGGGTLLLDNRSAFAMPAATASLWDDGNGSPLVEGGPLGRGRVLRFTRALTPEAMPALLEPDFATRLRALLQGEAPPPSRVEAVDYAPVAGVAAYEQPPRVIGLWLAGLIALLFAAERWLATRARAGARR